jgi:hypothetical protein
MNRKNMKTEVPNFELIKESIIEGHTCTCSLNKDSQAACGCCGESCKCSEKSLLPLTQMKKGQSCKIAYIKPLKCEKLHKILSVLPGSKVKIIQTGHSPVFQVENVYTTIGSTTANSIYVNNLK